MKDDDFFKKAQKYDFMQEAALEALKDQSQQINRN